MLDLLRERFFDSLIRASFVYPTFFKRDEVERKTLVTQAGGFSVWFTEDEIYRWKGW